MKRFVLFLIVPVIVLAVVPAAAPADEKLSAAHKEWLEVVSPIITRAEREIFSLLKTGQEREKFIRLFWKQRDSNPDTSENEFFKEYMARVDFADKNFGRTSSKRGCLTDRGLHYLILGPPLERTYFTTQSEIWPLELWFYKGEQEYGLPPYFYLIFYQPEGFGDYRLYYPGVEGPEKLAVPLLYGKTSNRETAYQVIRKINGELADASRSYFAGERPYGFEAFSSDSIIASVRSLPEKKYSDSYARSYLTYKDYIETEYSDNFIGAASKVMVFWKEGLPLVHWSIEPEKMSFGLQGSTYYADFEILLRTEDRAGNLVFEKQEEIPLRLTPEQYKANERRHVAFQDVLPLIPGDHKLFFLLKNKAGKDFTSFEAGVSIPKRDNAVRLSSLLLFHGREKNPDAARGTLKAFNFENYEYLFNTRNEFLNQETMGCYFQVSPISPADQNFPDSVLLEIRSLDAEAVVYSQKKIRQEIVDAAGEIVIEPIALAAFKPGYYSVEVSLVGDDGRKLGSGRENFIILAKPYPVLPWPLAKVYREFPDPEYYRILGSQYFSLRDYMNAKEMFEEAFVLKDQPSTRLLLGKALYALGDFKESLAAVVPAYEASKDREAAKVIALNYAGLKDWASAAGYLEKLMAEATEIGVLNLAAECYLNLNQPDRALPLLQKSLSLVPSQSEAKALEARAKKLMEKGTER